MKNIKNNRILVRADGELVGVIMTKETPTKEDKEEARRMFNAAYPNTKITIRIGTIK